jgi:polyisoprenoid-binding protein YceI
MSAAVETGPWQLDPARSTVTIRHKTMWGLVTVKGTFTGVSGGGEVLPDGTVRGTLTLDAASLDTKQAKRDKHLRSADFFHVEKHPEITYTVRSASLREDGTVQVAGDLTVRGITRPLSFIARADQAGQGEATVTAEVTVDRADFDLKWNQLGMLRGLTTATVSLRFTHRPA